MALLVFPAAVLALLFVAAVAEADPALPRLIFLAVSRVGVTSTPLPPLALPVSYAPGIVIAVAPALELAVVLVVETLVGAVVCELEVFECAERVGERRACSSSHSRCSFEFTGGGAPERLPLDALFPVDVISVTCGNGT